MPGDVIYWAERRLNEPYPKQHFSWIGWGVAAGYLGVAMVSFALVASVAAVMKRSIASEVPTIQIAHLDIVGAQLEGQQERDLVARAPAPLPQSKRKIQPELAAGASKPDQAKAAEPKTQKVPEKMAPEQTRKPVKVESALVTVAPPIAKQHVEEDRAVVAKSIEKKPVDIAPGEKLGIQAIMADGIVLLNGRKIRTGSALPNGEVLVGTDPAKGMAETDRRVLVLTP